MEVRDAVATDAAGIASVRVRAWQQAYRGHMPQDVLDGMSVERNTVGWRRVIEEAPPGGVLLVADDGDIRGFCSGGPGRGEPDGVGEIYAIYVDPDHWFEGVGTAMMDAAVERLAAHGYTELVLWVLAANRPSRRFYESRGWVFDEIVEEDDAFGFTILEAKYRRPIVPLRSQP